MGVIISTGQTNVLFFSDNNNIEFLAITLKGKGLLISNI